jgi:Kef-type K+ transport system membrane component KefB
MDQLTALGLILLLALLAGHLVRVLRIPEVTGYILAGVALGPSLLGWLSHDSLAAMRVLAEIALGLILFSVGSAFEFSLFRRIGRHVLVLTLVESALASIVVTTGALILGQSWPVALLLGAVAIATAPASTLMVVRECDSAGPVTDHLLGIIAVNNLLCISVYSVVAAGIDLTTAADGSGAASTGLYGPLFSLVWQFVGSASLGFLIGLLLAGWSTQVLESGETLILLAGSILLAVGICRVLDLSPLVASLAIGATLVNLTLRSRRLFSTLSTTDPPFYAIFFVIAGAELDVTLIPSMGLLGVMYLVGRAAGKFAGIRLAARWLGLDEQVQRYLGFALLAQAGLAIGLTLAIAQRFPDLSAVVSTVILAAVAVSEIVGPISARFALVASGEAGLAQPGSDRLLLGTPPEEGT